MTEVPRIYLLSPIVPREPFNPGMEPSSTPDPTDDLPLFVDDCSVCGGFAEFGDICRTCELEGEQFVPDELTDGSEFDAEW
jgi:hypothetical protein